MGFWRASARGGDGRSEVGEKLLRGGDRCGGGVFMGSGVRMCIYPNEADVRVGALGEGEGVDTAIQGGGCGLDCRVESGRCIEEGGVCSED